MEHVEEWIDQHCKKHETEVIGYVNDLLNYLSSSEHMEEDLTIPSQIAFCTMDIFMQSEYKVVYDLGWNILRIYPNAPVDQSKFTMLNHAGLDINTYELNCVHHRRECMFFQLEYNQCTEDSTSYCNDASQYMGMQLVSSERGNLSYA